MGHYYFGDAHGSRVQTGPAATSTTNNSSGNNVDKAIASKATAIKESTVATAGEASTQLKVDTKVMVVLTAEGVTCKQDMTLLSVDDLEGLGKQAGLNMLNRRKLINIVGKFKE